MVNALALKCVGIPCFTGARPMWVKHGENPVEEQTKEVNVNVNWIPQEKPPDKDGIYIVVWNCYDDVWHVSQAFWDGKVWERRDRDGDLIEVEVSHWMPFPTPPSR
jgi:phosphatidylserine decarboxylase